MEDCIIWEGKIWAQGRYGMDVLNGKSIGAHRAAWIRENGEIPDGLIVCHKCDNGVCVNVNHLFLGTHRDNMQDCKAKGRLNSPVQRGSNNNNARRDYHEIRIVAKRMRANGFSLRQIRMATGIKSNGHLVKILKYE